MSALYAIRGKGKIKADYGIRESYTIYKDKGGMLKYSKYSKLVRELNEELAKAIIFNNLELEMPYIGTVRVKKFQTKTKYKDGTSRFKKLRPDWAKTKQLWAKQYPGKTLEELKEIKDKPIVRHLNEHTNGYSYEFYYNKTRGKFRNKSAYAFLPSRGIKNMLSAAALDPDIKVDYYE